MNIHPPHVSAKLRIWQQNLNASLTAQTSLLNSDIASKWDIIVIQEPYINFLRNTHASHRWHVLYPTQHFTHLHQRTHAITLVNATLNTNSWKQIAFPSSDIVIIQLTTPQSKCSIFNIYNDGNKQDTLLTLDSFLIQNINMIRPQPNDQMLWLGDFNRHHPLWEEPCNRHLYNLPAAQPLIDLIADFNMLQLLPNGLPTLQALNSGNWTCPDNAFGTTLIAETIISCTTEPSLRGPKTDHVPILLILELDPIRHPEEPHRNWKEVDWKTFNDHLGALLAPLPPVTIATENEFQAAAHQLTQAITDTMEICIPLAKPCPHSKRWWSRELSNTRRQVNKLHRRSYQMRGLPNHPCHDELKAIKNTYANDINKAKQQHWLNWLEEIEGNDLWTANRYISSEPKDGGKTRIPTLTMKNPNGSTDEAVTNDEKSIMIAKSFFPPPPLVDSVPPNAAYPVPIETPEPISHAQIIRAISALSVYKAPGPDGISNIVFKSCIDLLVPYLVPLFNAVFTLRTYYEPWRSFTTIVLRKPTKPSYSTPKSYRPIALLNTTCKLLTAVIAEQLTHILEHHQLLPNTHFGGRPSRSTMDSLHLLESTIKDAWRSHKVVSVLFLDIEGAFPNAVTNRLIHDMRMRRIPKSISDFTKRLLTNRRTQLRFDGYTSDWIPINNGIGQGDPLSMILYIIYSSDLVDVATPRRGREAIKELTLAFVDDTAFITIAKDFATAHQKLSNMLTRPGGGFEWSQNHNSKFEPNKFALMDFSMNRRKARPSMNIQGAIIKPSPTHRFLGVILDQELRWTAQVDNAIAKGTAYICQLRRLATTAKGIPLQLMHQLYQATAVPKMLYAASLWFTPAYQDGCDRPLRGSLGVAKRLSIVQRMAVWGTPHR